MDRIDRIRNWQDFVFWWRMLPEEQKFAAIAGIFLFGMITALIANGKGRNPVLWFIVGAIFPLIGMIVALSMSNLRQRQIAGGQTVYVQQQPTYVPPQQSYTPPQQTSVNMGAASITDEIQEAKELLDNGTITQAEFEKIKAKLLGR